MASATTRSTVALQDYCSTCQSFCGCPLAQLRPQQRRDLGGQHLATTLRSGRLLYAQGAFADALFVLCSGSVKLLQAEKLGRTRIVAILGPGEWFGLDALLPPTWRVSSAIARRDSILCRLDSDLVAHIAHTNAMFAWHFALVLNNRLHDAQRYALAASGDRARHRMQTMLKYCTTRSIAPKHVELAQLLGVAAETISREFHHLNNRPRH